MLNRRFFVLTGNIKASGYSPPELWIDDVRSEEIYAQNFYSEIKAEYAEIKRYIQKTTLAIDSVHP